MSYRKSHIKSKIHKTRSKKSIFKRPWFWFTVLFLIIIFTATYFALFYSGIQIKNIIISGNQKVSSKDIESLVLADVNNKILVFGGFEIYSKSILLAQENKINTDILNKFPVIGKVVVNKNLPQTLTVSVVERQPLGVFCDNSKCFYIDQNGIIFEPLAVTSPDTFIVRQNMTNTPLVAGQEVIAQSIVDAISKIQKNLNDNFKINLIDATIENSSRLNITTSENFQIYFSLSSGPDINSQLTKLSSLLGEGISADDIKNLRYIDLRPKDRAIVCDNSICGGK